MKRYGRYGVEGNVQSGRMQTIDQSAREHESASVALIREVMEIAKRESLVHRLSYPILS